MSERKNTPVRALGIAFILIAGVFLFSFRNYFNSDKSDSPSESIPMANQFEYIDAGELHEKILRLEKLTIIDIRPKEMYELYHMRESKIASLESAPTEALNADSQTQIILIGTRTDTKTLLLTAAKIKEVGRNFLILSGGYESWKNLNLPGFSSGDPTSFSDQTKVKYIPPLKAKEIIMGPHPPTLLDVRPTGLYAQNHIKNSLNIPLDELELRKREIPELSEIIVYGSSPTESFRAGVRLFDLGIFAAKTLDGGFDDIKQ